MRPRFTLRALFVLTTIVALGCWWLVLPSLSAQRFVRAINSADYQQADACFQKGADRFLEKWNDEHWQFAASAELESWTFREVLRGQRRVQLHLSYGGPSPVRIRKYRVTATRSGLLEAEFSGGVFGHPVDSPRTLPTTPIT
jgi:hypothetical protein